MAREIFTYRVRRFRNCFVPLAKTDSIPMKNEYRLFTNRITSPYSAILSQTHNLNEKELKCATSAITARA